MKDYLQQQVNITLTDSMVEKFNVYCDFLRAENEKYNLTAITEVEQIWIKHFADSILGSVAIPKGATLCDVGSGAGFPSLPLKIVRDDISVTLVDSLQKRINFTKALCEKIDVQADFFHERAEDFAKNHSEQFDIATARAVAPLNTLLEYVAQIVKIGGAVVAYKTDLAEVELAENASKILGMGLEKHYNFVLPDGSRRAILVYRKIKHTPSKYPRGQNKPRTSPLTSSVGQIG
ncbi:MAG: 16S rRNA (guanine(527)-N(7))-methyltransferase RsmG [Clostridiales bacterium]|nr:16S rRNA (guanine(527)-N(7))-methyltransferase RsmG [Clostridiales bacterium]